MNDDAEDEIPGWELPAEYEDIDWATVDPNQHAAWAIPRDLCLIARDRLRRRWPEAEAKIAKDPMWACRYAQLVIKDRWPEAEETIKKDAKAVFVYAKHVLHGRWREAEEIVLADPMWGQQYANRFLDGKFSQDRSFDAPWSRSEWQEEK